MQVTDWSQPTLYRADSTFHNESTQVEQAQAKAKSPCCNYNQLH